MVRIEKRLPNARFWIWYSAGDCWVKLTLKPGQTITLGGGGPCDEGWSYWSEQYEYDQGDASEPPHVVNRNTTEAMDCDGRLDHYSTLKCGLDRLRARNMAEEWTDWDAAEQKDIVRPENIGVFAPEWERLAAWQRDHEAERAGY